MGRGNTAGAMRLRQMAGVMTALGLVILMIAFLVAVPAGPALADEPEISGGYSCGLNRTWIAWTASAAAGVATADGTVRVDVEFEDGTLVEIGRGEFNDGNGYSFSSRYRVPRENEKMNAHLIVTAEQGFVDGTGVGSTDQTADFYVPVCKDGTTSTGATTTTEPSTTTSLPTGSEAVASGACELIEGTAIYPIEVTVSGDEGATGTVEINGATIPYTIDADGEVVITAEGGAGTNTIVVTDDVAGVLLDTELVLEDCSETTTTSQETTTTTQATTTTTEATTTTTEATTTTTEATTTTTEATTTSQATTATTSQATTTTEGETSSGGGSTPDVSVLPQQIEQETLPETGLADGELALVGVFLVVAGAGLLMVTNRKMGFEGR